MAAAEGMLLPLAGDPTASHYKRERRRQLREARDALWEVRTADCGDDGLGAHSGGLSCARGGSHSCEHSCARGGSHSAGHEGGHSGAHGLPASCGSSQRSHADCHASVEAEPGFAAAGGRLADGHLPSAAGRARRRPAPLCGSRRTAAVRSDASCDSLSESDEACALLCEAGGGGSPSVRAGDVWRHVYWRSRAVAELDAAIEHEVGSIDGFGVRPVFCAVQFSAEVLRKLATDRQVDSRSFNAVAVARSKRYYAVDPRVPVWKLLSVIKRHLRLPLDTEYRMMLAVASSVHQGEAEAAQDVTTFQFVAPTRSACVSDFGSDVVFVTVDPVLGWSGCRSCCCVESKKVQFAVFALLVAATNPVATSLVVFHRLSVGFECLRLSASSAEVPFVSPWAYRFSLVFTAAKLLLPLVAIHAFPGNAVVQKLGAASFVSMWLVFFAADLFDNYVFGESAPRPANAPSSCPPPPAQNRSPQLSALCNGLLFIWPLLRTVQVIAAALSLRRETSLWQWRPSWLLAKVLKYVLLDFSDDSIVINVVATTVWAANLVALSAWFWFYLHYKNTFGGRRMKNWCLPVQIVLFRFCFIPVVRFFVLKLTDHSETNITVAYISLTLYLPVAVLSNTFLRDSDVPHCAARGAWHNSLECTVLFLLASFDGLTAHTNNLYWAWAAVSISCIAGMLALLVVARPFGSGATEAVNFSGWCSCLWCWLVSATQRQRLCDATTQQLMLVFGSSAAVALSLVALRCFHHRNRARPPYDTGKLLSSVQIVWLPHTAAQPSLQPAVLRLPLPCKIEDLKGNTPLCCFSAELT
ncbi:hypothetical protein DIPPA_00626 [Diplonema papillatum]|nr:hypothetical protein DIPPA_00626 [Diplonema papillatum]